MLNVSSQAAPRDSAPERGDVFE